MYELEAVSAVNKAGGDVYAESTTGFEKADKTLAEKKVASDAVIYVTYKDGTKDKETVLSGNELNGLGGDLNGNVYYVLTDGLISWPTLIPTAICLAPTPPSCTAMWSLLSLKTTTTT